MNDAELFDKYWITPYDGVDECEEELDNAWYAQHAFMAALAIGREQEREEITGSTSDGYHTFDELYDHRCLLFIELMRSRPEQSWRANNHDDGTMFDGWFVAGIHLPTGDITYHLPADMWEMLDNSNIQTTLRAPKWDGHTPSDVVKRLRADILRARGEK